MTFNPTNIPTELKELVNWVIWGIESKRPKRPYNASTLCAASVTDPSTWTDFETAVKVYYAGKGKGVGFVFTNTPYIGVDIDNCIDENGVWFPEAVDIYNTLNSYTEISSSGNGLHIICKGKLPAGKNKRKDKETGQAFEMYGDGSPKYFIMTGITVRQGISS